MATAYRSLQPSAPHGRESSTQDAVTGKRSRFPTLINNEVPTLTHSSVMDVNPRTHCLRLADSSRVRESLSEPDVCPFVAWKNDTRH
jgi:hypothetical protein